jgi:hypothetical protein
MARWSRLILLAVALLSLDGCVYLRLFAVKQQCGNFADNFDFAPGPGLTLVFKHPVLLAEDTVTLIGGQPTAIIASGPSASASSSASSSANAAAEAHWIFRYRRVHPSDHPAPAEVVALDFGIRAGMIERVSFPPEVFKVIPVDLAKAMMRAMGHAHVDQLARIASTQVDIAPGLAPAPDRVGIDSLFGHPDFVIVNGDSERRIYRYRLDGPADSAAGASASAARSAPGKTGPDAIIGIVFRNDLATAQQFQAGVSGLWLYLELPGAAPMPKPAETAKPAPAIGLGVDPDD